MDAAFVNERTQDSDIQSGLKESIGAFCYLAIPEYLYCTRTKPTVAKEGIPPGRAIAASAEPADSTASCRTHGSAREG